MEKEKGSSDAAKGDGRKKKSWFGSVLSKIIPCILAAVRIKALQISYIIAI